MRLVAFRKRLDNHNKERRDDYENASFFKTIYSVSANV